jgi:multiple sugar transport system substrate-binding protein
MSAQQHRFPRIPRAIGLTAAAATIALIAAGCAGPGNGSGDSRYGFPTVEQDADAPITILVDADRSAIAEAFKADNPDLEVNIETYDGNSGGTNSFQTKISLADAAGYTSGALDPVTVDGNVYGARDNLAPVVFWYNKAAFDEFGYEVPETWEDYQALSDTLAAEHPGWVLGSIGDPFTAVLTNMWSAQAPIYTVDADGNFTADFSDDHTTRMIALMDHMFANGTLTLDGLFTPDWAANHKDKVLGIPGPTWFTGAVIQNPDSLAAEPGTWAAGAPLHWEGEDIATGNVGGGFWYGSSHSANLEAVGAFLQYATSGPKSVELITGLPAYESTASEWLDAQVESGYWANEGEFKDVVTLAASNIWSGWGATLSFSSEPAWAEIVAPALAAGGTIESVVDEWKTRYENDAQVNGYTVK